MINSSLFTSKKISYRLFLPRHIFTKLTRANTRLYQKSRKYTQVVDQYLTSYKSQQVQISQLIYQAVFLGFALLFIILGFIIASQTTNWACSLYFDNCKSIKTIASLFCLALSGSSLAISFLIRPAIDLFSLSNHAAFLLLAYFIPTTTVNPFKVKMKIVKPRTESKPIIFFKKALEQMNRDLKNILV